MLPFYAAVIHYQAPTYGVVIVWTSNAVTCITLYILADFLFGEFSGIHGSESLFKDFPGFACPLIFFPDGELN